MRAFDFVSADSADQAVSLFSEYGPNVIVLAGGTDILVDLKHVKHPPDVVVDITRAEDLKGIEVNDEGLRIGALVTHTPRSWTTLTFKKTSRRWFTQPTPSARCRPGTLEPSGAIWSRAYRRWIPVPP